MKKTLHFLLFLFCTINCFSQFSKTHYIPPLISTKGGAEDQYLYISTPSLSNVNFKIIANGGNVINGTVNSTTPYQYFIGKGTDTQLFTPLENIGIVANRGYIIEAEDLIYVSARVNAVANQQGGYNHAGGLVSKGNSALGTTFRLGAMLNPLYDETLLNFTSIMATENGTKVSISNIQNGTQLLDGTIISGPINVTLNKNESYVLALKNYNAVNTASNSSKIIGALVTSDKPVAVNSGSFGGSNSTVLVPNESGNFVPWGRDVGFDQIVSLEKTGNEYIFIKGLGSDELERVLLVAHYDNTEIFLNGSPVSYKTLNSGEYIAIDGSQFNNGSLYVKTSAKVFAYQSIGGTTNPANQNLFFVPPINCATPNTVDNIPQIQSIGTNTFNGFLNIVTETGAAILLNNNPISALPLAIEGTPAFVRYNVPNLSGNIVVKSSKQVYVSYFGTNGAATYGGYYSGFDLKPEIVSSKIALTSSSCIPNVSLKINSLSSYDTFQWYKDDVVIPGEIKNNFSPSQPGFYQVRGSISGCVSNVFSDKIPVSECPINLDNDLANDNIDIDYDNDGLTNCTESYGDLSLNISNSNSGLVTTGTYSNSFSGTVTNSTPSAAVPFTGNTDGSFVTEVMAGKGFSVSYNLNFAKPINLSLEYVTTGDTADLLNSDSEYIINVDIDKTVTVLNPTDQLLIDTNYDGIYESGVTQFSSFEIRFRLNGNIPLQPGTGTFKFQSFQNKTFKVTHKNLLDSASNKSTFRLIATCVPKDSDGDGIPDQLDLDSDNDGIPDVIESQTKPVALSNIDSNLNGLDEIFEFSQTPIDSDNDGIPNYLDLDSDNDGIYDLVESGSNAPDLNKDGIIDTLTFGTNGLSDSLETDPDNGILKYTVSDSDNDGIKNYTEIDSDNDGCNDVTEAGFTDQDFDGQLGNAPVSVNAKGIVISKIDGYTVPNGNYIIATPILISKQPENQTVCELQKATFSIESNADSFQWQLSIDNGNTWNNLNDNTTYSGTKTASVTIQKANSQMNEYYYRVLLNRNNNACGLTSANSVKLILFALPILNSPITLVQCDDDTDGISNFNITEKNSFISSNFANETFSYYTTLAGANTKDPVALISNSLAFSSSNNTIWARVDNSNGCFSIAQLNLVVSTTQINSGFKRSFNICDDFIDDSNNDKDGIASFDFSSVTNDIQAMLPSNTNYSIKYYSNEADALAEMNTIADPSNYRNTIPNQQEIWVRVDSNLDNACFGLGSYITLIVNPKPEIDSNSNLSGDQLVCSNLPSFFVKLDAGIIGNIPSSSYTYVWSKDGSVIPEETNETLDVNEEGKYTVEVFTKSENRCSRMRTINVTASDIAHLDSVSISDLSDLNTVQANVSGSGNYEYSIDDPNGSFQESNFFEDIPSGIHELYIKDKNGCGTISKTIAVLGVPKFFTPNNDGYNDYWNIKGANDAFNSNTKILIFDRYGKLIKQITPSSVNGWDGTYSGSPLPADDYWYTIKLEDGRETKGHFSLKR
ncbi:T9SS type B sorting domain-containing protein [Flavobacterium sp. JLP]|uniref:T9SS type B sorting domain-containing protein n=1 Tax=unclassified Flavobacterium TaxID=196869 RepID=UPI00188D7E41|nr:MULTISPECIES: T9SS type B sorting domain-containing protein [unclassified Flavobacterium]MBF4493469.1 T9SS type B sorting domain-containing protein [Flavobacterium sp. MR2016-29]MBF4507982.1 T9SS type B sorting domain-containing protein [Flavobacterium sp. JLP]